MQHQSASPRQYIIFVVIAVVGSFCASASKCIQDDTAHLTLVQRQASRLNKHLNSKNHSDDGDGVGGTQSLEKPTQSLPSAGRWLQSNSISSDAASLYHDLSQKHASYLKDQMQARSMSNMSSNANSTFTLLTTLYLTRISQHTAECIAAIVTNLGVPQIGAMHILLEADPDECFTDSNDTAPPESSPQSSCAPLLAAFVRFGFVTNNTDKLICVPVHGNPTYAEFTRYMNEQLNGKLVMLTNSDVVFDATLADVNVDVLIGGKKVHVLSVKPPPYLNPITHQTCLTSNRCNLGFADGWNGTGNSWDTYILVPPLPEMDLSNVEHPMNLIGAENSYAYTLHLLGEVELVNMCRDINAFHWHCAKKTHGDWTEYPVAPRRYGNLMPSATGNADCSGGMLMTPNDTRILSMYKIAKVTTKLCCEGDIVSCEQAWYAKRYPAGKVGNRSLVLCEDSAETGCAAWLGDLRASTTVTCPPLDIVNFTDEYRAVCNWEFGPLWAFSPGSEFPTLVGVVDGTEAMPLTTDAPQVELFGTDPPNTMSDGIPMVLPVPLWISNTTERIEGRFRPCGELNGSHGTIVAGPGGTNAAGEPVYKCGDRLLIFCEGKGASTSLTLSMRIATHLAIDYGYFDNDWEHALKTHKPNEALQFINRAPSGATIWLITTIRNFVHQVVSSMFEDLHYMIFGDMATSNTVGDNARAVLGSWKPKLFSAELETMSDDDLMNHFMEQKMMVPQRFNQEFMMPILGIDLGTVPFDHERSRQFISLKFADGKQVNVIGLRFEDLSKWAGILTEYFPNFPEVMEERQKHEEELIGEKYKIFKSYLDKVGYFNALSLEELRSFPNQNYYTDCEVVALTNLAHPVALSTLPAAGDVCNPVPTKAPTPYPNDAGATTRRKGCATTIPVNGSTDTNFTIPNGSTLAPTPSTLPNGSTLAPTPSTLAPTTLVPTETPTPSPTETPTVTPTFGNWETVMGCFDSSHPWTRIDDMYCADTTSPTLTPTPVPTYKPTPLPTIQGHWVINMECHDEAGLAVNSTNCPDIQNDAFLDTRSQTV